MNRIIYFILFFFVIFACERNYEFFELDCENCYQDKPECGPLIIYFSFDDENDSVSYTVYRGNFESREVEYTGKATFTEEQIDVPVNEYYSVEALYLKNGDTIHVVDGDKFKLKKETSECDKKCYYFKDGMIDVRLKE